MEYLCKVNGEEFVVEIATAAQRCDRISHHVKDYRVLEVIHRGKTERMIEPAIPILILEVI